MRCRLLMAGCVVVALLVSAWAAAGQGRGSPRNWALVVAVSHYDDQTFAALPAADNDADVIYRLLTDKERGIFAPDNVQVMKVSATDPVLLPKRRNIIGRLQYFLGKASKDDTVLFYFSGHGAAEDGNGYLLAQDTQAGLVQDDAVPLKRVNEILASNRAARKIVVLDACYSGIGKAAATMNSAFAESAFQRSRGRATLTSCDADEVSYFTDDGQQSVFTHYLQEALSGAANPPGNSVVTLQSAYNYVYEQVSAWAGQRNRKQTPRLMVDSTGEIALARAPANGNPPRPATKAAPSRLVAPAALLELPAMVMLSELSEQTQTPPQAKGVPLLAQPARVFSGHAAGVNSVAFSPDRRLLASGSDDKAIKLWDLESGACLRTLSGHGAAVDSLAFSPNGKLLASGSDDKAIGLWEVVSGKRLGTLAGHTYSVTSLAFSPDGRLLASGSWDSTVRLWDVKSGSCLHTLEHATVVVSVAFSPDGRLLATASGDGIRLWDARSGKPERAFPDTPANDMIVAVAFSPDGRLLASGSWDHTARLWDVARAQCVRTFSGHADSVTSVAFSPDGRLLASGSWDCTARIWDVRSGAHLGDLTAGHRVKSVTFSPTGEYVALSSLNDAQLWEVPKASAR